MSHTFAKKKAWTKSFRVGRSDIDAHTYKSMQNLKYGNGRDLFPMVRKGFLYIKVQIKTGLSLAKFELRTQVL